MVNLEDVSVERFRAPRSDPGAPPRSAVVESGPHVVRSVCPQLGGPQLPVCCPEERALGAAEPRRGWGAGGLGTALICIICPRPRRKYTHPH